MSSETYNDTVQVPKKTKNPRRAIRGFFYSIFMWRLIPQTGHQLFIAIQPFVDAVTHYTSHNGDYKTYKAVHIFPPSRTCGKR